MSENELSQGVIERLASSGGEGENLQSTIWRMSWRAKSIEHESGEDQETPESNPRYQATLTDLEQSA